jgi:hypothetical protein
MTPLRRNAASGLTILLPGFEQNNRSYDFLALLIKHANKSWEIYDAWLSGKHYPRYIFPDISQLQCNTMNDCVTFKIHLIVVKC